ncbi:hypothetical protein STCU_12261 [Strigomonas culicis]|uniref:Uncharacterized protein n=1 Tax=Strigomonas culicis TaxID=28005 RepID=S9TB35_9TRYP|nr:hypothetical protein STCU_12261 [Strigomonas culicis]|eukprot:EPY15197.1 hypothetical protein STCU_12261 [Strigomonas culicis]
MILQVIVSGDTWCGRKAENEEEKEKKEKEKVSTFYFSLMFLFFLILMICFECELKKKNDVCELQLYLPLFQIPSLFVVVLVGAVVGVVRFLFTTHFPTWARRAATM